MQTTNISPLSSTHSHEWSEDCRIFPRNHSESSFHPHVTILVIPPQISTVRFNETDERVFVVWDRFFVEEAFIIDETGSGGGPGAIRFRYPHGRTSTRKFNGRNPLNINISLQGLHRTVVGTIWWMSKFVYISLICVLFRMMINIVNSKIGEVSLSFLEAV